MRPIYGSYIQDKRQVWKILDKTKAGSGCVHHGDEVILQNQYKGLQTLGFEIINAVTLNGNKYESDASTGIRLTPSQMYGLDADGFGPYFAEPALPPAGIEDLSMVWKILDKYKSCPMPPPAPAPTVCSTDSKSSTDILGYGDELMIQNQHEHEILSNGYRNGQPYPQVSSDFHKAWTVWKILDKSEKGSGCVEYGDEIIIQNQDSGRSLLMRNNGGYMRPIYGSYIQDKRQVWKILDKTKAGSGCVHHGDEVILQNQYKGLQPLGFKKINAVTLEGNKYQSDKSTGIRLTPSQMYGLDADGFGPYFAEPALQPAGIEDLSLVWKILGNYKSCPWTPDPSAKYTQYLNKNTYSPDCGAATRLKRLIGSEQPQPYTVAMCAAVCDADPDCDCFVSYQNKDCHTRGGCVTDDMCDRTGFDTYMK